LVAAVRELQEETGLLIDATRLVKLDRVGPIVTPVEQQGSGVPYHMQYYGLDLRVGELPKDTEPTKQGPWELRTWVSWVLGAPLTPYSAEMIEKFRNMPSRDE
jgi:8-oxo-dGTP pyrophosphatase MutT (NUDIX family)